LVENGHAGCRLAEKEDLIENAFCFVAPALHDVIREKVKISGAGQRRGKTGLLHQGSVQNVNLENAFWPVLAAKLASSVLSLESMPEAMKARADELAKKRYRRPEWLSDRDDLL
jgi:lipoate-protein ligase A